MCIYHDANFAKFNHLNDVHLYNDADIAWFNYVSDNGAYIMMLTLQSLTVSVVCTYIYIYTNADFATSITMLTLPSLITSVIGAPIYIS